MIWKIKHLTSLLLYLLLHQCSWMTCRYHLSSPTILTEMAWKVGGEWTFFADLFNPSIPMPTRQWPCMQSTWAQSTMSFHPCLSWLTGPSLRACLGLGSMSVAENIEILLSALLRPYVADITQSPALCSFQHYSWALCNFSVVFPVSSWS